MGDLIKKPIKKKAKKKKIKKSFLQKRKDNPRSKLWDNKALWEWGRCVREKFKFTCAVNNKDCSGRLEAHHLITRDHVLIRHDIMNGILLCSSHHQFNTELSAHKGQVGFGVWMQENRPVHWAWVVHNRWKRNGETYDYEENYNALKSTSF